MNTNEPKLITVAYRLYSFNADQAEELVEEATVNAPFQFISQLGITLEAFEAKILLLNKGDQFDFTLSPAEAYGEYEDKHVVALDKSMFEIDGHFDSQNIYVGNVIPLVNEDGLRFQGEVTAVGDDTVTIDLNHPLAGFSLHFTGEVVESRPATKDELEGMIQMLQGDGCHCGCHDEDGECHHHDGDCCHHHKDGCEHHGEGHHHCHHHHDDN